MISPNLLHYPYKINIMTHIRLSFMQTFIDSLDVLSQSERSTARQYKRSDDVIVLSSVPRKASDCYTAPIAQHDKNPRRYPFSSIDTYPWSPNLGCQSTIQTREVVVLSHLSDVLAGLMDKICNRRTCRRIQTHSCRTQAVHYANSNGISLFTGPAPCEMSLRKETGVAKRPLECFRSARRWGCRNLLRERDGFYRKNCFYIGN